MKHFFQNNYFKLKDIFTNDDNDNKQQNNDTKTNQKQRDELFMSSSRSIFIYYIIMITIQTSQENIKQKTKTLRKSTHYCL